MEFLSTTEANCREAVALGPEMDEHRNGRDLPLVAGRGIWRL